MSRLHPVDPELLKRAKLPKPVPAHELQLQNHPREEEDDEEYPRWDLLLEYWDER